MNLIHLIVLILLAVSWDTGFAQTERIEPDSGLRVIRSLTYGTYGKGRKLLADVYLPSSKKYSGPSPTILMIHGGAWMSGNKSFVAQHARHAANHGYAVVAINYRLAPTHKFPAQLEDCRSALTWIARNAQKYSFANDKLIAYGYSAGAHLACLIGMTQNEETSQPQNICAVVAGGSPCEFSWIPEERKTLAYWLGDSQKNVPETYRLASPINFVDRKDPPVFLYHGAADRIVPISSSKLMFEKLSNEKVDVTLHVIPDANHLGAFVNLDVRDKVIHFLDSRLALRSK